tara:strand:+ start:147 stop:2555 length:2409 start_codon:yes stop_codon:yes gene_type:complete
MYVKGVFGVFKILQKLGIKPKDIIGVGGDVVKMGKSLFNTRVNPKLIKFIEKNGKIPTKIVEQIKIHARTLKNTSESQKKLFEVNIKDILNAKNAKTLKSPVTSVQRPATSVKEPATEAFKGWTPKVIKGGKDKLATGGIANHFRKKFDNGSDETGVKLYPRVSIVQSGETVGNNSDIDIDVRDVDYGITGLYEGNNWFAGAEIDKGNVKVDVTQEGETLFKDTMGKDEVVNFIAGFGDPNDEKFQIKVDDDFENISIVLKKSFATGGIANHFRERVGFNVAGSVSPKVQKLKDYLSTLDSGTKVQPTKLSREFNIDRTYISKIIKHEFPNLESLGRKDAALLTQKNLKTKRMTTSVDVPTPVAQIVKPGEKSRMFVDVRWPNDTVKENYLKDFKEKRLLTKPNEKGPLSNEAFAKKFFGKADAATIAKVERINNVLQNQYEIKYKKGDPNQSYLKRKENIEYAEKYSSVQDRKDLNAINNKKEYLNKYFKDNPNAINETKFGRNIKKQMDIRIAGEDMEWEGKKIKKGEIWFKTRPNSYYYNVASSDKGIFHIFDINPIKSGERFTRVPDNINLSSRDFNSGFIKQLNEFFKKDGKLYKNQVALDNVIKTLNKYNIRVKIDDVGRIGEHEKVAVTGKENRTFPRINKTLEIFELPKNLTNFSENVSVSNRTKPQIFARKILDTGQKAWSKLPFKNFRILPSGAIAATDFTLMSLMGVPPLEAATGASGWLTKKPELAKATGTVSMNMGFMNELNQKKDEEKKEEVAREKPLIWKQGKLEIADEMARGGLSGVDNYILNRYK